MPPPAPAVPLPCAIAGIGYKLMVEMGWTRGAGLGRHKQGRAEPLEAVKRPKNLGLGA